MFRFALFAFNAFLFSFTPIYAQSGASTFLVELNKVTEKNGACEIVLFAHNDMGKNISDISLKLAVVDAAGQFNSILSLPLGAMRDTDSKFASYTLQMSCAELSKVVVNDVANCSLENVDGSSNLCNDQLEVNSRELEIEMAL